MRVAHRNGPDYGIDGVLELLANFWQNGFLMTSPLEGGKVRIAAYLLVIWMVGLGGLEPPTSPLSGAFMVLYA